MKNKNNNDNKSLFLYTSLIFIVAILLIILAFFGQTNIKKNQPEIETSIEETEQPVSNSGIAERASVLSEENRILLEEKNKLEEELRLKNATISGMENERFNLNEKIKTNDLLLQANGYMSVGNLEKAAEALNSVDYDSLSSDQQIIYNNVKNKLN